MRSRILVLDQNDGSAVVRSRTLKRDVARSGMPKCAWCKKNDLRPLVDIVQSGFSVDLVYAACYCDYCQLATVVIYEVPISVDESEVANRV